MYPNLWKCLQAQSACYHHKPFAKFGERELTFDTLIAEVETLSTFLRTATDKSVIGIDLADPLQSITSIFATLVAGKAFWTTSKQIIEKTEPAVLEHVFLLEERHYSQGISYTTATFGFDEEITPETPFCWATSSGSLATPKITEHSYYSLIEDSYRQVKAHKIGANDKIDVISSLSFSASLSSIFPALLSGASLHFYDASSLSITAIYQFWQTERITMTTLIPTVFRSLLQYEFDFKSLDLRFICIGGEPVQVSDIALFQKKFPTDSLLQVSLASSETRGIAEHITTTTCPLPKDEIIYDPVAHKKLSIVDTNNQTLQPGENGLIAITSNIIGTRYAQGPDNFIKQANGERLFVSDDIGAMCSNGKLKISSRANSLVKHKGEFIDLDQTTSNLLHIKGVLDCYVSLQKQATVLGIVVQSLMKKSIVREAITRVLGTTAFQLHLLTQPFPKTHSGKLDIPVLRTLLRTDRTTKYTDEDLKYYQQWEHTFPSESEFEGKHFFTDLGGDSISATELTAKLCKAFGLVFEPNVIYLHPRYEELFHYIKNAEPYLLKVVGRYDKNKDSVLFFPTIYGKHTQYLSIINRLEHKYNFFLIQYATVSEGRYELPKDIAEKCADLINKSDHNFICMAGFSFSGYLAYWTAHYLIKNTGLILLDSHTYRKSSLAKKTLVNTLRLSQLIYQQVKRPIKRRRLIKRPSDLPVHVKKTEATHQNKSSAKSAYDSFFQAFLQKSRKLPSTNFPMGVFKAKNHSDIRYTFGYDFNWSRHNTNIQFTKSLEGNHRDFWREQKNAEVIAREIDTFIEAYCD